MELEGIAAAVKRIVDVRIAKNGTRYFRICWKDTWEPEAHLLSCQDLLDDFLNNRKIERQEPENSFVSLTDHKTPPKIQCDRINTTTNKQVDPALEKKIIQSTSNNPIKHDNAKEHRKDLDTQLSRLKQQMLDFSAQFHSPVTETAEIFPKDSLCCCGEIQDITETRDVGCQCEPVVRHFAVQKQESNEKPEVAEVSVQAEPTVCCTSTQYVDPLRHSQKKTNLSTRTPNKLEHNVENTDVIDKVPVNNEMNCDLGISNQETVSQQLHIISDRSNIMSYSNLIQLDYSQIPAELLQQILQNTTTAAATQQAVQQKTSAIESVVDDSLKPMYFVVDGNTENVIDEQAVSQTSAQSQNSQGDVEASYTKKKKKATRGRKRKSDEEVKLEGASKQKNKIIHSRNLFPQNLQPSNTPLQQPMANVNSALVVPVTVNASVYQTIDSPNSIVNSPVQTNLNVSNVSAVSTVYDPHPPISNIEAIGKQPASMASNLSRQSSVNESQISSFRSEENKINEDFISKYWK